jgi:glycine hydroxymethyltransferase
MQTQTRDLSTEILGARDPSVAKCLEAEWRRQESHLELIASENIVSEAVLQAQGSILTNKYAEGYVGRRYYEGCEAVDGVERLAQDRLKKIFGCAHANVQPHSGSSANLAVFFALLTPGDKVMALSLNEGGHLTHGAPVNFSGKWFEAVPYGIDEATQRINMNQVRDLALKERPRMIIAGTTAYPRVLDFKAFREIADEVGAYLMADIAHIAGLVATEHHPSPFPHAHVVTSTTHKTLRGPRGGIIMTQDPGLAKKIDMAVFPGLQGGPLMHVIAAKAVAFGEALRQDFRSYIGQVVQNAKTLALRLQERGVALAFGGTDNHMLIADLRSLDISGARAAQKLASLGLVCNKNTLPGEIRPPSQGSGIRLGSPACTTRGMREEEFRQISDMISDVLHAENKGGDGSLDARVAGQVRALAAAYPLPYRHF